MLHSSETHTRSVTISTRRSESTGTEPGTIDPFVRRFGSAALPYAATLPKILAHHSEKAALDIRFDGVTPTCQVIVTDQTPIRYSVVHKAVRELAAGEQGRFAQVVAAEFDLGMHLVLYVLAAPNAPPVPASQTDRLLALTPQLADGGAAVADLDGLDPTAAKIVRKVVAELVRVCVCVPPIEVFYCEESPDRIALRGIKRLSLRQLEAVFAACGPTRRTDPPAGAEEARGEEEEKEEKTREEKELEEAAGEDPLAGKIATRKRRRDERYETALAALLALPGRVARKIGPWRRARTEDVAVSDAVLRALPGPEGQLEIELCR